MPEVGAVGGRLLLEDGRLQHAGILFENGGYPGHIYHGFAGEFNGYSNNVLVAQNYLAVTGACLMTAAPPSKRSAASAPPSRSTTTTWTTA